MILKLANLICSTPSFYKSGTDLYDFVTDNPVHYIGWSAHHSWQSNSRFHARLKTEKKLLKDSSIIHFFSPCGPLSCLGGDKALTSSTIMRWARYSIGPCYQIGNLRDCLLVYRPSNNKLCVLCDIVMLELTAMVMVMHTHTKKNNWWLQDNMIF
jgi:hypothetical protein